MYQEFSKAFESQLCHSPRHRQAFSCILATLRNVWEAESVIVTTVFHASNVIMTDMINALAC